MLWLQGNSWRGGERMRKIELRLGSSHSETRDADIEIALRWLRGQHLDFTWPDSTWLESQTLCSCGSFFFHPLPSAAAACCSWSPAELVTENVLMTLRSDVRQGRRRCSKSEIEFGSLDCGLGSQVENPNIRFARDPIRCMYVYVYNLTRNQLKVAFSFNCGQWP